MRVDVGRDQIARVMREHGLVGGLSRVTGKPEPPSRHGYSG